MSTQDDTSSVGAEFPIMDTIPADEGETFFEPAPERLKIVPGTVEGDQDEEPAARRRRPHARLRGDDRAELDRAAKTGIPSIDEWMDFFSRVLIKVATDYYIDMAFRNIDEDMLTDREVSRIKLANEERDRIARPFAELAYKSKYTRKHGRSIIAAAGSIDAVVQLGMWYSRVGRIARKYQRMTGGTPPPQSQPRMRRMQPPQPQPPQQTEEGGDNVGTGQSTSPNGHDRNWRPPVNGTVIRNFDGG